MFRYELNEFDEMVAVAVEPPKAETAAAAAAAATGKKRNHWDIAQGVIADYPHQLAFHAGEFWTLVPGVGWVLATSAIYSEAARVLGTAPDRTVIPILSNCLAIPTNNPQEACYWLMTSSSKAQPLWAPLTLDPTELLFADCIYNVVDKTYRPHPGIIFGPMISLRWVLDGSHPDPSCPEFEALVNKVLPDPEIRRHFQEVAGTILQPHVNLRGQIIMWGKPYSGKTTLATAIGCCPAGRNGVSQLQEGEIIRDKFSGGALIGRFANISDDSGRSRQWQDFLKRYTSGSMTVRPMYTKPSNVTPTAKLISTCNHIQALSDASGACIDRFLLFKFEQVLPKVSGTTDDEKMTVAYWSHPERRSGILTWLVEGLERLRNRGRFDIPTIVDRWLVEAEASADEVIGILREKLVEGGEEEFVTLSDLNAMLPTGLSGQRRNHYVTRLFPSANQGVRRVNNQVVRVWLGLKLA